MKKWQHAAYIAAVVVLAAIALGEHQGLLLHAEDLLYPPIKDFSTSPTPDDPSFGVGKVTFSGAWKVEGSFDHIDKTAYKYICIKKEMTCQVFYTPVSGNVLLLETDQMSIQSWDDKQITISDLSECRPTIIAVDLRTEQVSRIDQDALYPRPKDCDGDPLPTKKMTLVSAGGEY